MLSAGQYKKLKMEESRSGRLIKRYLMGLVFLLCPFSFYAAAQEPGDEDLEQELEEEFELLRQDEEVVFSASKYEQKIGWAPAAVVVITREDIEATGATTLAEVLRHYTALRIFESNPGYPSIEARTLYRAVLFIDGREVNHEIFLQPFLAFLPLGLQDIERIEIVLGPNSAIYGANAVSAVINVFTRPLENKTGARATVWAGERGGQEFDVTAETASGPWRGRISAGYSSSDSWQEQGVNAKRVWRAQASSELEIDNLRLSLDAGFSKATGTIFALLGNLYAPAFWAPHAQFRLNYKNFTLRSYWYGYLTEDMEVDAGLYYPPLKIYLGKIPTLTIRGDTQHDEVQLNLEPWSNNKLVLGADFRYVRYYSTKLIPNENEQTRFGVFFHDEQKLAERLSLQAGLRYDWNSKTDQAVSPRGAVIYRLAEEHFLRLSGGLAFRKPTLLETEMRFEMEPNPVFPEVEEFFEKGMSNPDMKNELLSSVELGWRGSFWKDRLSASVDAYAAFNRQVAGFSANVVFDSTPLGPRLNLEKSRLGYDDLKEDRDTYGAQIKFEARPTNWLEAFIRADLRYGLLVEQGNRVYRNDPQYMLAFGLGLRPGENWRGQFTLVVWGEYEFTLRQPESVLVEPLRMKFPVTSYAMLYLGRVFKAGPVTMEVMLNFFNIFGKHYREGPGVIDSNGRNYGNDLLGRRFMTGLKIVY